MSFGVGVGDIIEVTKLAYQLCGYATHGRKSAPKHYSDLEQSLQSMKFALNHLQTHSTAIVKAAAAGETDPGESEGHLSQMKTVIDSCNGTLLGVDDFLKKYLLVKDDEAGNKKKGVRWKVQSNYEKIKFGTLQEKQLDDLNRRLNSQTKAIDLLLNTYMAVSVNTIGKSINDMDERQRKQTEALAKLSESVLNAANKPATVVEDPSAAMIKQIYELVTAMHKTTIAPTPATPKLPREDSGIGMERSGSNQSNMSASAVSPPPAYSPPRSRGNSTRERSPGGGPVLFGVSRAVVTSNEPEAPSRDRGVGESATTSISSVPTLSSAFQANFVTPPPPPPPPLPTASAPSRMMKMGSIANVTASRMMMVQVAHPPPPPPPPPPAVTVSPMSPSALFDPHTDASSAFASSDINKKRKAVGKREYDAWMVKHAHSWGTEITIETPEDVVLDSVGSALLALRVLATEAKVKKYVHISRILSQMWIKHEEKEKGDIALDMLISLNETIRGKKDVERDLLLTWLNEGNMDGVLTDLMRVAPGVMFEKQVDVFRGYSKDVMET